MAAGNAGKRKNKEDWKARKRAAIPYALFDSYAWAAISAPARQAFLRIVIEHGNHGAKENGALICTYKQFEDFGIHPNLIARAIRELVAVGLIEVTRKGVAGPAEHRNAALYLLTYAPEAKSTSAEGKHTYERIKTREEAEASVRLASNPVSTRDITNGHKSVSAKTRIPPSDVRVIPPSLVRAKRDVVALRCEGDPPFRRPH